MISASVLGLEARVLEVEGLCQGHTALCSAPCGLQALSTHCVHRATWPGVDRARPLDMAFTQQPQPHACRTEGLPVQGGPGWDEGGWDPQVRPVLDF